MSKEKEEVTKEPSKFDKLKEMWKDKRGRAKIKLCLYLIFFVGVVIFARVLSYQNSKLPYNDNVNDNVSTEVDIKENTIVSKKDELSLSSPSEEFIKFNQWLDDHCPFVLKVKTQMTEPEYQKLLIKYTKKEICDVLESLNNWKDFPKKRTNVYRSTLDELKKKFGER